VSQCAARYIKARGEMHECVRCVGCTDLEVTTQDEEQSPHKDQRRATGRRSSPGAVRIGLEYVGWIVRACNDAASHLVDLSTVSWNHPKDDFESNARDVCEKCVNEPRMISHIFHSDRIVAFDILSNGVSR